MTERRRTRGQKRRRAVPTRAKARTGKQQEVARAKQLVKAEELTAADLPRLEAIARRAMTRNKARIEQGYRAEIEDSRE